MSRRLAAALLALVALFGVSVSAPQPARADDGVISNAIDGACRFATGPVLGTILGQGRTTPGQAGSITGMGGLCDKVGDAGEKKIKQAWKAVWDSILGDVINSAADAGRWTLKKVLTVALLGPSLDLEGTGLFGKDATLAGMLTWLGLVIAAFGVMWQIGKMALTGRSKHLGRSALGWVENLVLSTVGVAMIALLSAAGDAMTRGLVDATFKDDGDAVKRIVAVMLPNAVSNPITMAGIVAILLILGFIQLILVFLRNSAIPIQCLLLPVAGGGRAGGDVTRQWAPRLITSICVTIAYKPMLAVIICVGFAEFGRAQTIAEWLRGCATLILAVLAPAPLVKIFAPFGESVGQGMSAGGIGGAFAGAAGYVTGRGSTSAGEGAAPASALDHARYVEQSMGGQGGRGGIEGEQAGADAQAQATRNDTQAPTGGQAAEGAVAAQNSAATPGQVSATGAAAGGAGAAAGAGAVIQVLDGVNNSVQDAAGQIGHGGSTQ